MTEYKGILTFHSETGTEGGAWAFQDEKFMNLPAANHFTCTRCHRVWDKDYHPDEPKPSFTYWRDDWEEDGIKYIGGYHSVDTYDPDGNLGPYEFDAKWNREANEIARQCAEEGHPEWKNMYPDGMWSYEGLHILHDGDQLTVYDNDQVLFDGVVELPPRQDPYAEDAYAAGGYLAAHRRPPVGTNEDWWFQERRATLVTHDESVSV
jgi:hypothetical protein